MSEETKYWWDNNPTCVSGLKNTINSWQEPYKGEYPKSVTLPYSGGPTKVVNLSYTRPGPWEDSSGNKYFGIHMTITGAAQNE